MKIPLFDIDGTLVRTKNKVHEEAFNYAFKTVYNSDVKKEDAGVGEGRVDNEIIISALKAHGFKEEEVKEKIKLAQDEMENYFKSHMSEADIEPLVGVEKLLRKLKNLNIPMGILSGNMEEIGWTRVELAGLRQFFSFGAFGNMAYKRLDLVEIAKTKAEEALRRSVETKDLVIIGDTPKDIICAKEAGIESIIVATGIYTFEELEKDYPNLLVNDLESEGQKVIDFLNN